MGLGAATVSSTIFEHCRDLGPDRVRPFVMSDAAAIAACVRLAADHRVLVEPACGAAVAAVLERSEALRDCSVVVVEVCGGAIVDIPLLTAWACQFNVPLELWGYGEAATRPPTYVVCL